jgi:hypothetical protein
LADRAPLDGPHPEIGGIRPQQRIRLVAAFDFRRPIAFVKLTVEMIHKIGEAWKIPADLLVRPYKIEQAA